MSDTQFPIRHPVDGEYVANEAEFAAKNQKYGCKSIPTELQRAHFIREAGEKLAAKRREDIAQSIKETKLLFDAITELENAKAFDFSCIPRYQLADDSALLGMIKKWSDAVKLDKLKRQLQHETEKLSNTKS